MKIERLVEEVEEKERKATQALQQAEQALRLSREEEDTAAELIATEAKNVSQQALDKAGAQKLGYQKRSREIDALLGRGSNTEGVSQVLDVKGEVFVKTRLGYVKVGPNFELRRGEEIRTGQSGELTLQVGPDGSNIRLYSNSVFIRAEKDEPEFELSIGKLKAWVKQSKSRRFSVRTVTSAVGVRGTEFEILATADLTETRVYSGQVEVTPLKGRGSVLVGAGQKVVVDKSGKVIGPYPLNTSAQDGAAVFVAKNKP
ncbi:MAG: FecR family protein [Gammaproteobacteria bacterium]|nr:FecR family protein [Gammaproteobacteria bacterium]